MKEQEHNEKAMQLAGEWFRTHVATRDLFITSGINGELIDWRRPDISNYAVNYMLFGFRVIVTGDLGDAVYGFSQTVTAEKLRAFDWHYFVNKCCASETGRHYTMKIPGIKQPVTNTRAIAHYVGLQMALQQLERGSR